MKSDGRFELAQALQAAPACVLEGFDGACEKGALTRGPDGSGEHTFDMWEEFRASVRNGIRGFIDAGNAGAGPHGECANPEIGPDEPVAEISYETACCAGAELGAALIDAVRGGACVVESLGEFLRFLHGENCGKCVFCREGILHLSQMLGDITGGLGKNADLGLMEELAGLMRSNCLCPLGGIAANPVLRGLGLFREDFEVHVKRKVCPCQ